MQEESGGVAEQSAAPSPTKQTQQTGKKSTKKKTAKIPTVQDIVEKTQAEDGDAALEPSVSAPSAGATPETKPSEPVPDSSAPAGSAAKTDAAPADEADDGVEESDSLSKRREALNLDSETALMEAVLFLESEPQTVEALAKISELSVDVVEECMGRLREKYANADSGIELSQIIGGWILTPKKESFDLVKERYGKRNEGRLSKAAIETLSIIAYSQPITRAEIESIRHVNADTMMRILLDRKFIKEVGKKDVPGKPVLYGTTKEFLEFFHLQSIADLPQLDEKESERFELAR